MKKILTTMLIVFIGFHKAGAQVPAESLLIGPGDLIKVHVFDTPELDESIRVTDAGNVHLLLGQDVKVIGLTPVQAADRVREALITSNYMVNPKVVINVEQYATQNVTILGQVRIPGSYSINTPRSITDVLALAGGLNDVADRHITIERHGDPSHDIAYMVPNSAESAPAAAVMVFPGDTVVVPKAGIVYVLGDVGRPGGYVMNSNDSRLTVVQVVAMAAGTNKTSAPAHARLVRNSDGNTQDTQIPLDKMEKGKEPDMQTKSGDIIYVPFSYTRNFVIGSSSLIGAATTAAIYRF